MKIFMSIGRIHCKDGASLSVQAREHTYCEPRINPNKDTVYTKVEVGYIKDAVIPESWASWNDDGDIFGYVPVELVEQFIQDHGGIDVGKTIASIQERCSIDYNKR